MWKGQLVTLLLVAASALLVIFQAGCSNSKEEKVLTQAERIEKGKYLVELGGCNDCHSP